MPLQLTKMKLLCLDKQLDHYLVEMMEQQVLSQVEETQLVVVVKLKGYDMHVEISMVEKNELVEELMIAVMDTEQNVTEFDG
ncbi:hypothetical protein Tco_0998805 [Tanacetum coccineum]